MFKPTVMLLAIASCACAQTPQQLLQLTQDTYQYPDGYELKGKGFVQAPGSSWQVSFDVGLAAAPTPFSSPRPPAMLSGRVGGQIHFVNVLGGSDEKPTDVSIPFVVAGLYKIAENVESVTETGSETLPLNAAPCACRVLQVQYKAPPDQTKSAPVSYSICSDKRSDKHLVLKKVMLNPIGRRGTGLPVPWTITFDTAEFHRPAPAWLLDLKELPAFRTHKEWTDLPAPDFKLADLDGNSISLSSLRGKVVLLDFWSVSCGPCTREIPIIEAAGEAHKADLVVWGISFDQPQQDKKWLVQHQRTLPTLSDTDFVVSDLYRVPGIPAMVLIGADGMVNQYWDGEVPQSDIESAIQRATGHS